MDRELNYKTLKRGLFVIFLLLLVPAVFAAEKTIFSGELRPNNATEVDGKELSIAISGGAVVIDYGYLTFFVFNGECEVADFIEACVNEIEGSFSATIVLSAIIADLEINKTIKENKDEFVLREVFNVELIIKNTENRPIDYIKIEEDLKDFEILNITGCAFNENLVSLETRLNAGSRIICLYKLRAVTPGDFELETKIDFFNGYENKSEKKEIDVEVIEHLLKLETDPEENYELGEKAELFFEIESTYPYKVTVYKLEIQPEGIEVLNSTWISKKNKEILKWTGEIEANSAFNFTLDLQLFNVSNELLVKMEHFSYGGRIAKNFSVSLPVEAKHPEIKIKEIKNDSIIISLKNTNSKLVYNKLKLKIKSSFNNIEETKIINLLNPDEEKEIEIITTVDKAKPIDTPMIFSGEYYTIYDEKRAFSTSDFIRIEGTKEQEEEESTEVLADEGEETQVETELKKESPIDKLLRFKYSINTKLIIFAASVIVIIILFFISMKAIKNPK